MMFLYPGVFHKEEGAYWVEFPDLPGCQSFGDDLAETMANAQEALEGYLLALLEEGSPLAKPSEISKIAPPEGGFVSLVCCNLKGYKNARAVKKTLTIPAWLNDRAVAKGLNFSQVLQEALLEKTM